MKQSAEAGLSAGDIASIVTAAVAVIALIYTAQQLRLTRQRHLREDVYRYVERFYALDALPLFARTEEFVQIPQTKARIALRIARWNALGAEAQMELVYLYNLLDQLGMAYNRKAVDRDLVRDLLGDAITEYWEPATWFVAHLRKQDAEYYSEWEKMRNSILASLDQAATPARRNVQTRMWDRAQMVAGGPGVP